MAALINPSPDALLAAALDITQPNEPVEVRVREDGKVLWVNVGGVCVLRICQADIGVVASKEDVVFL